ncbi:hypothetical protein ACHAXT_003221 [Thalassiosira profunda]
MIDAGGLTTAEVRAQYVLPLIREMAKKSGLADRLGADVSGASASSAQARAPPAGGVEVRTLFQEIAADCNQLGAVAENDEATSRCYAELLEEASALCAYLTPQEAAFVSTIATSCLLAFLVPQCHFQGFLHSYYASGASKAPLTSLDERLTNATLSNHNGASGGVFPYSASRMGSLVADDDLFIASSFRKFLVQGLGPFLSSGLAFGQYSKDDILSTDNDAGLDISCDEILKRAGFDLVQLLAMAICPNPLAMESSAVSSTNAPSSLSMEADKGAGGEQVELIEVGRLASSTRPFSFQLTYSDRLQLVRLCADLVVPEGEDGAAYDVGGGAEANSTSIGPSANENGGKKNTLLSASLRQLRSSLFGFASYGAHAEEDAQIAYEALANVAINEGDIAAIQAEFQRLLEATLAARSGCLAEALGGCLAKMITRYNGSREYADGPFVRHVLGVLGECINENARMGMADPNRSDQLLASAKGYESLLEGTSAKRQKVEGTTSQPERCKPYHLVALLKATEPLFYFILNSNNLGPTNEEGFLLETKAKSQLIRDIAVLLCYPSSMAVVQSAAKCLALALSYHGKFVAEKSNVKYLFRLTKQALSDSSGSAEKVQALRPLIITASTQSASYAVSLLSFAISACPKSEVAWKIASLLAFARPSVASERLAELKGSSQCFEQLGESERDEIMTRLSCTMASYQNSSLEAMEELVSLTAKIDDHWTLYQLVRYSFGTSNFGFARRLLEGRRLPERCSTQQSFLWLSSLSKLARAEEILGIKGAVGISKSLEELNSCHSLLSSLAASSQKFGFQLEFVRVRIELLNLCMITRSLCSENILTGGSGSARSKLHHQTLSRNFGMLQSQCIDLYRLFGLHYCQQTRSALRTFIALCHLMSDVVDKMIAKPNGVKARPAMLEQEMSKDVSPKGDARYPITSLMAQIRSGVLEKQAGDPLSQARELLSLLDVMVKCPLPFPRGFFRIKPIPSCVANLSVDPGLLPIEQETGASSGDSSEACVVPGIPFKLVVSGVVPEEFLRSADVEFSLAIAWMSVCFVGQLYEEEDAEDPQSTSGTGNEMAQEESTPDTDPASATMQPRGEFVLPIICDPIMREGCYRVEVTLGCRDVRCGEWLVPTKKLNVRLRVEDYSN